MARAIIHVIGIYSIDNFVLAIEILNIGTVRECLFQDIYPIITSRVSGRGHRIGAVFLCVCLSVCLSVC